MRTGWIGGLLMVWLAVACSGGRDERLNGECVSTLECPAGAVCLDGMCSSENSSQTSVNASGRAEGASADIEWVAADGVTCVQSQTTQCTVAPGSTLTLRAPEVEGHRFVGWSGGAGCQSSSPVLQLTVSKNVDCIARYVRRVKVTGAVDAGGVQVRSEAPFASCADNACTVDLGDTVILEAPQRDGFKFSGWQGDGCEGTPTAYQLSLQPRQDTTCTALFTPSLTVRGAVQGAVAELSATSSSPAADCSAQTCAVEPGAAVQLRVPQLEGFRFVGWSGDPSCTGSELTITVADVRASITCTASYVPRRSARAESEGAEPAPLLTASSSDAFATCAGPQCEVDQGGTVTLVADTVSGFRLTGWTGDGCQGASGASTTLTNLQANAVCTARFVRGVSVSGTVLGASGQVEAQSVSPGASCGNGSCAIDTGGSVTLTAPTIPGRTFLGWSGDTGCTGSASALSLQNVSSSVSCIARFAARYTVAGVSMPGTLGAVAASSEAANARCEAMSCEVDEGASVTLEAQPNSNARFLGWSGGGPCSGSELRLVLPAAGANLTCRATFIERVTLNSGVTPDASGSAEASSVSAQSQCSAGSCTVDAGASVSVTANPATGFRFVAWSGCSTSTANPLTLAVSEATTCTARMERITYLVVARAGSGGGVSARTDGQDCSDASCVVPYDGSAELRAEAAAGFAFAGWSGCGTSIDTPLTIANVRMAVTCTANFVRMRFTVSAIDIAGGVVSATTGNMTCANASCGVDFGGTVTLHAEPDDAHTFAGWSCGGAAADLTFADVMANHSCTPSFPIRRYTVSVSAGTGGSASIDPGTGATCSGQRCTVDHDGSVTLRAIAQARYTFSGWSCGGTGVSRPVTGIHADLTCAAMFTLNRYDVNASAGTGGTVRTTPGAGATCTGSSCSVGGGGAVTFTAEPNADSAFANWTCSVGTPTGSQDAALSFRDVGEAHSCVANFRRNRFTVTVLGAEGLTVQGSTAGTVCANNVCTVNEGGTVSLLASSSGGTIRIFQGWSCPASTPTPDATRTGLAFNATLSGIRADYRCQASSEPLAIVTAYQATGMVRETVNRLHACVYGAFGGLEKANNTICYVPTSATVTLEAAPPGNQVFDHWRCLNIGGGFPSNETTDYIYASVQISGLAESQNRYCEFYYGTL